MGVKLILQSSQMITGGFPVIGKEIPILEWQIVKSPDMRRMYLLNYMLFLKV